MLPVERDIRRHVAVVLEIHPHAVEHLHGLAELRGLEIANWRLLLSPSAQRENPAFASVLKTKGVEIQQQIAALMLRIAGPNALARSEGEAGVPATRYFFTRASSIYGGTSEVQKDVMAKVALG